MNANQITAAAVPKLLGLAAIALLTLVATTKAQVKTQTKVERGPTARSVKVERGEVVYVSGNDLVIKMEDGEIRHFPDVLDTTRFTVDGKGLSIHDLKPGMKLQRTTVTSTTPRMITTVKTVTGKVWHVTPPSSVILTLEDGTNQSFKIAKGQKFTIDGKETDAFGLKKGMNLSATAITEVPETVVSQEVRRTGTMPPPPEAPKADVPILVVVALPAHPPVQSAEAAPKKLPQTASHWPLVGLLGVLFCSLSLAMKALRTTSL
ncbi:MAG: hypothetical protein JSS69_18805 [Acidobacteria bacterium]|nr:hypothetical protein [Acidobacteriota bacterium]MBS1867966.1 hypothetical protein [Acidobacteriota bacterium]